jgi:DNA-binding CsgD family transcriptional regulator
MARRSSTRRSSRGYSADGVRRTRWPSSATANERFCHSWPRACPTGAIAERLFITERTVEAHVTQMFLKLSLTEDPSSHRRALAVLAYLRHQGSDA